MASKGFKISGSKHHKLQKAIAAFDDEAEETDPASASGEGMSKAASEAAAIAASNWVEKGTKFAEDGDAAAALRCWDQAVLIQPNNSSLHEMRAQVLNDLGQTFEAVEAAQRAVNLRPDWPEAHITLARVQLNLGEPQLALSSYQAAARLQPSHPDLSEELPRAQMYAKLHQQQTPGTRAHVTGLAAADHAATTPGMAAAGDGVGGTAAAAAAAAGLLVEPALAAGAEGHRQRIGDTEVTAAAAAVGDADDADDDDAH